MLESRPDMLQSLLRDFETHTTAEIGTNIMISNLDPTVQWL